MFYMYNRYSEEDKCSPAIDDSKIIDFDTLQKVRQDLIGEIQVRIFDLIVAVDVFAKFCVY